MADAQAFDQMTPPLKVTNPGATVDTSRIVVEYPRHLHGEDGSHVEVTNDLDKAARLAEGYHLTPDAAKAAVVEKAAAKAQDAAEETATEEPRRPGRPRKAQDAAA